MRLVPPTLLRAAVTILFSMTCALAPAATALAHNGTGGSSSDYRIQITGFDGDATGITLRIVELGNRLELHRTSAQTVMVHGYSGEPYLRLDASGVSENDNSPAHYLDLDRFASTNPPATASATADPAWTTIADGSTVRWHDHRAHWMSMTPRADVISDPDVERVIFDANRVDMVIDGRPVSAIIRVTWLPKPDRYIWLGAAALGGLAIASVFVLGPGTERILGFVALDGAIAALLGQGGSTTRHILGAVVIAVALLATLIRRPLLSVAAAITAGALAATRIEVFEHELLAGWLPAVGQRIGVTIAIALCLGVVASALVGALGPTTERSPSPTVGRGQS